MKKTGWFPGSVLPARSGLYEVFTNNCMHFKCTTPHLIKFAGVWELRDAALIGDFVIEWRGLTKEPK